jgi:hypothetical protein
MKSKQKWILEYGVIALPQRRAIKPIGRLFILGKYLTVEQSSNYLKAK